MLTYFLVMVAIGFTVLVTQVDDDKMRRRQDRSKLPFEASQ